jgi:hypothetical protein
MVPLLPAGPFSSELDAALEDSVLDEELELFSSLRAELWSDEWSRSLLAEPEWLWEESEEWSPPPEWSPSPACWLWEPSWSSLVDRF